MFFFIMRIVIIWSMMTIILWGYCRVRNIPLSYVLITGKRYYTTNDIVCRLITKLEKLGTIITQDINIIQQKIENLPWVQKVVIRKQWPDILNIYIVEHVPIAFWNTNQILSDSGVVFYIPEEYRNNNININLISFFSELEGSEHYILIYYHIFNAILSSSLFQIQSMIVDARYSWELILSDDIRLKLGKDNVVERLLYFIRIYPFLLKKIYEKNKNIDYVDLRYDSGVAVKWISNIIGSAYVEKNE